MVGAGRVRGGNGAAKNKTTQRKKKKKKTPMSGDKQRVKGGGMTIVSGGALALGYARQKTKKGAELGGI